MAGVGGGVHGGLRLIPVYAGSTQSSSNTAWSTPAHPRLRGEHQIHRPRPQPHHGSSPSTRGAPRSCLSSSSTTWLIPVYAGSTEMAAAVDALTPAHPRLRGEHRDGRRGRCTDAGSSPSTRGAHGGLEPYGVDNGLIPVYAGSTVSVRFHYAPGSAHPRLRGEHRQQRQPRCLLPGSSPSTRGAQPGEAVAGLGIRLIPVYAGSTQVRAAPYRAGRAHPRLRGEHLGSCPSM